MKKTRVIVFGTFDLLHPGHLHLLKEAKEYWSRLVAIHPAHHKAAEVKSQMKDWN